MKRYRFRVEYDGSCYHGWQIQAGVPTIQEELQRVFAVILQENVHVAGSGRTDAGVHALDQMATLDTEKTLSIEKTTQSINRLLPPDIRIRNFEECSQDFSARYDASSRLYLYKIYRKNLAYQHAYGWDCSQWSLDLQKMKNAATSFLGIHDFLPFCIPRNDGKNTLCEITDIQVLEGEKVLELHIAGNRFLHRMVRAMTGILIDIGRGQLHEQIIAEIFERPTKKPNWTWAPAKGLCLIQVRYP